MTRRVFLIAAPMPGFFAKNPVHLEALVAPVLPARLSLPGEVATKLSPGIIERRTYRDPQVKRVLREAGVDFVEWGDSLLFSFASLEARARAWTEITGKLGGCAAYEFALYRWA